MSESKKSHKNYSHIDKEITTLLSKRKQILLNELEEQLEIPHKSFIKAITRLEQKGKIRRERIMREGLWLVQIKLISDYNGGKSSSKKKKTASNDWDTMNNLPCFTCPNISKCSEGIGSGKGDEPNPKFCTYLTNWIEAQIKKVPFEPVFSPDFEEIRKKKRRRPEGEQSEEDLFVPIE